MGFETGRPTVADPSGVTNREQFADFVQAVLQDYEGTGRAEWENSTLPRLLDALAAVSYARTVGPDDQEPPTWRLFAELFAAATGYE